jgi:hypothetical protein
MGAAASDGRGDGGGYVASGGADDALAALEAEQLAQALSASLADARGAQPLSPLPHAGGAPQRRDAGLRRGGAQRQATRDAGGAAAGWPSGPALLTSGVTPRLADGGAALGALGARDAAFDPQLAASLAAAGGAAALPLPEQGTRGARARPSLLLAAGQLRERTGSEAAPRAASAPAHRSSGAAWRDDAALAAHLQAEEDVLAAAAQQQQQPPPLLAPGTPPLAPRARREDACPGCAAPVSSFFGGGGGRTIAALGQTWHAAYVAAFASALSPGAHRRVTADVARVAGASAARSAASASRKARSASHLLAAAAAAAVRRTRRATPPATARRTTRGAACARRSSRRGRTGASSLT